MVRGIRMTNKSYTHKEWSRALLNVAYADLLEKSRKVEKELAKVKEMLKNHVQCSERYKAFIMTHCREDHSATESELLNLLRKLHSGEMDSLIGIQKSDKEGGE